METKIRTHPIGINGSLLNKPTNIWTHQNFSWKKNSYALTVKPTTGNYFKHKNSLSYIVIRIIKKKYRKSAPKNHHSYTMPLAFTVKPIAGKYFFSASSKNWKLLVFYPSVMLMKMQIPWDDKRNTVTLLSTIHHFW